MLGLDKSEFAKKILAYYIKFNMRNYHGIQQKEIQGSKMMLNLDDSLTAMDLLKGVHSFAVTSCFYNELEPHMTVFDIGANIGYYTLLSAKICSSKGGQVIAFEPSKKNCELMEESIKMNSYHNIRVINKGVAEKNRIAKLYVNPVASVDNRIIEPNYAHSKTIDIELISLDDFVSENKINPDFIKIDVQGAEYMVIDGMSKLLNSNKTLKLIIEFGTRTHGKMEKFISCLKHLKDLGFQPYYLKEPRNTIDVKSKLEYENQIKFPIYDLKNHGFSKFDEIDLLFIRK